MLRAMSRVLCLQLLLNAYKRVLRCKFVSNRSFKVFVKALALSTATTRCRGDLYFIPSPANPLICIKLALLTMACAVGAWRCTFCADHMPISPNHMPQRSTLKPRNIQSPRALPILLEATIDAITTTGADTFEPRADPAIALAAAVAAVPPIIFWIRIALNEQRRRREAEDKERAREVSSSIFLIARLTN